MSPIKPDLQAYGSSIKRLTICSLMLVSNCLCEKAYFFKVCHFLIVLRHWFSVYAVAIGGSWSVLDIHDTNLAENRPSSDGNGLALRLACERVVMPMFAWRGRVSMEAASVASLAGPLESIQASGSRLGVAHETNEPRFGVSNRRRVVSQSSQTRRFVTSTPWNYW